MTPQRLIERLASELAGRNVRRAVPGSYETQAAVSLLLRPATPGLEFLAIKRSENERDPWSGHMALPGGRRDPGDESLWMTAVRETREEIGLDLLDAGRLLGQLDDVTPGTRRIPAISITPFVVAVPEGTEARTSTEVEFAVWVPVKVVTAEEHRGTLTLEVLPDREFATIEYAGHVIWGLTLRILRQLEEVLKQTGYSGEATR